MHKTDLKAFEEQLEEVKIENGKYNLELRKKNKEMLEKIEEMEKIKQSLSQFWDEELNKVKTYHDKRIEECNNEINQLKEKFEAVKRSIEVIKNFEIHRKVKF